MNKPASSNPFNESPEAARARRSRSIGIAIGLLLFVGLVFAVTMLKLTQHA